MRKRGGGDFSLEVIVNFMLCLYCHASVIVSQCQMNDGNILPQASGYTGSVRISRLFTVVNSTYTHKLQSTLSFSRPCTSENTHENLTELHIVATS